MNTYWLVGKEDFTKTLPDFDQMFKKDGKIPIPLPVTKGKAVPKRHFRSSVESGYSEHIQSNSVQTSRSDAINGGMKDISNNGIQGPTLISVQSFEEDIDNVDNDTSTFTTLSTLSMSSSNDCTEIRVGPCMPLFEMT